MSSSYEDSVCFIPGKPVLVNLEEDGSYSSDSFSSLEDLNLSAPKATKNKGGGGSRPTGRIEPLMFRDDDPPRRWVGNLENIDTEEAAFELRQQVNDFSMTGSTTQFDALEVVQDTDPVFAQLYQRAAKEKEKKIPKNIRKSGPDCELDITSLFFNPITFLSQVHKNTTHERLEQGILKLATTAATRSHNIKRLVSLHFGQFVHCKDTIDLIQVLLKPELPPESSRLELLASRMRNLPWLLNTFSPTQLEQLHHIITNKRQQQTLIQHQQLQQRNVRSHHSHNHFTFGQNGTPNQAPNQNQNQNQTGSQPALPSIMTSPSSISALTASLIGPTDQANPFGYGLNTQTVSDKSRIGRLQLVLSTVAEKTDLIYSPLLTRRSETDQIRSALAIFRKYKLLLELPMRMRQHITNGRVDRLVHDSQRINVLKISKNPSNYILQQALTECQQIRSHYAQVLLRRLEDPRHNLYSQQRTMSYLFQLEDKIDPTWYYLERQCLHVGNLLDRAYYDSSFSTSQATFISLDTDALQRENARILRSKGINASAVLNPTANATANPTSLQIGPDLLQRLQSYDDARGADSSLYSFRDGDYGDDELDDHYNMWHNGPNAPPTGPAGSSFSQTIGKINQIAPPTSYMEYDSRAAAHAPLPLFMRKPQHLTQAHAELIATNLLHIFSLHIQPLLRLCYNVGNGTLFDVIKSNSLAANSSGDTADLDIGRITLNRHFISAKYLERISTSLVGNLTSKLVLYLSSLCIPGLDLREISGFSSTLLRSLSPNPVPNPQAAQRRGLEALDLAMPSTSIQKRSSGASTATTTATATSATALNKHNTPSRFRPKGADDSFIDAFPSSGSTLGALPNFNNRSGAGASLLGGPLPHTFGSSNGTSSSGGFLPYPGSASSPQQQTNTFSLAAPTANTSSSGPFQTFTGSTQLNNQKKGAKIAATAQAAYISSVTDDAVYHRRTRLHTVILDSTRSVLPRSPDDPIAPIPVANFSHIVLHLLSTVLLSLVNNNLVLLEPNIIDPLLSFYVKLYRSAQQFLLISATVQVATLKESFALNPASVYYHNQSTTLPIQFQHIIDTFLQSMVLLPSKQLLFRAMLYFNSPPQFTVISDYTELVLAFADRLHSIAIPQNPTRQISGTASSGTADVSTETTTVTQNAAAAAETALLKTTTEETVTTKVITTKTIIGKDGKKQVITSEETLEDEVSAPTVELKATAKAQSSEDFFARDQYLEDFDSGESQIKAITISRFGRELLSLAEQLNYNEHSSEPYPLVDVVAANAQTVYNSSQKLQSSVLNQLNPLVTSGLTPDQITHITSALQAGLSVDGIWNPSPQHRNSSSSALGTDRVLLSVLSNTIHTSQTIIPRAWRSLAELIQQSWPAKELLEMSFYLNVNGVPGQPQQPQQQLLSSATRIKYTAAIKNDLTQLKQKYNPTGRPGTRYSSSPEQHSSSTSKHVSFPTGLTDSEDTDTDTSIESSYDDLSSDLESLYENDDDDDDDRIINSLGLQDEIWSSLNPRQRNFINTAVVGGLGVAMSLALDNSYRKVQGVYLQLQTILVQRYILNKTTVINSYLYDSLFRGGINWRRAPVPTHVREFLYSILQHLVEAKSEIVLFQNIDFESILTSIIEHTIVSWCQLVRNVRVLSYNGAMQLALETNFLCRSMNRYTSPYAISLCQDLLTLLHSYIEETIVTENVNTSIGAGSAVYTAGDGFDSQLFDAVSRLGIFTTTKRGPGGGAGGKVDDNTGYEFSTSVSPLQSMLTQHRDQRSLKRRSSQQIGSIRKENMKNEASLLQSALGGERKKRPPSATAAPNKPARTAVTHIDDDFTSSDDDLNQDPDDIHEDDSFFDQNEEDDEASLVAGVISMRDLKSYTTQQVNKDLMVQFRIHTTHLDIENIFQQALWSTRLSFATLRLDPEDPLFTLILDESSKGATPGADLFQRTYRTPEEVVDGYFKARYNANRLRENIRLERSEEEKRDQLVYQEWIKQNNLVYNSSLESPELYVNLSIGQSKKYRELVTAQRSAHAQSEIKKIHTKYSSTTSSSTTSFGSKYGRTIEVTEENDPEPEDFGVKVTRLVTKRKEVVEKTKLPKEKKVREKKTKHPASIPEEEETTPVTPVTITPNSDSGSSSDLEDLFPTKKATVEPVVEPKIESKLVREESKIAPLPPAPVPAPKPVPAPLVLPVVEPVKTVPTPPATPKTIIEERIIVTTTTTKQQQQLEIQRQEEERRRKEKEMLILAQYQKKSSNLDFLDDGGKQDKPEDEFNDLDLQAVNFSYKVAKKEKANTKPTWEVPSDSSSSSEDEKPLRTLPPPLPDLSSSSESDIPEFVPKVFAATRKEKVQEKEKVRPAPKAPKEPSGPQQVSLKGVKLHSERQRRERKTNRRVESDDDDDIDLNMDFGLTKAGTKSTRTKKVDVSDFTEQQRTRVKDQQAATKNNLRDKIDVPDMGAVVNAAAGAEDTSKLTVEEKRRRQIKMRIKRTKDGKYIDLDTGEEIDPSMFKKQLGK